jgi:DUF1680 family protein
MANPSPSRRQFLAQSAAVAGSWALLDSVAPAMAADNKDKPGHSLTDTSASLHAMLRGVNLGDVKWSAGFWADRFTTCRKTMIPNLWQIMKGTDHSQFYHNFRIAAGLVKGRHRGPPWNDGDFYKWLEGAAAVYAVTRDRELDRQMDEIIRVLGRAQRADGYLHTPVLIKQRQGAAEVKSFQDPLHFETYNLGHLLTAACVHYRATGKTNLLNVARKAADYLDKVFKDPTPKLAQSAVCPTHYMGMVEMYRTTREPRYLKLARKFIDLRDRVADGSDDNQDRIPFRKQTEAVGHAARANYLYAGVADVYAETGDKTLLEPLRKIWENMATRKMYVTGGCGTLYDGASPDGSKDQKHIRRTHQAYGRDYQLPNSTAHNETCAAVASVLWNWRMLQITGEARFADVLELVLYNALLAGVSLDGKQFFYTNTLRQLDRMPAKLRWSRTRQPFISCFCCPPNLVRTVAEVGSYAYGRSDHGIWVHLYGGNILDTELLRGGRVKLTQKTDYPWDGRVKIAIQTAPADPFALILRIPGWAKGTTVQVNNRPEPNAIRPGSYVEVKRLWKAGDIVELNLPLRAQLLQAHPLVEEARNHVAVKRGPVVYCLESPDLPKGVTVSTVTVPSSAEFTPRFDGKLLGGVTVLEGNAQAVVEPEWQKELYREFRPVAPRPIKLKLIPYYAWGNRGRSEMTVWLPLGR